MKTRMKTTCANCKASEMYGCSLGYKTKSQGMKHPFEGIEDSRKPLEPCPKPLTIRKAVDMSLGKIPGRAGTINF